MGGWGVKITAITNLLLHATVQDDPAQARVARPAARGGADRKSAFQAVPAILLNQRYAVSLGCAQRCRCEHPILLL